MNYVQCSIFHHMNAEQRGKVVFVIDCLASDLISSRKDIFGGLRCFVLIWLTLTFVLEAISFSVLLYINDSMAANSCMSLIANHVK